MSKNRQKFILVIFVVGSVILVLSLIKRVQTKPISFNQSLIQLFPKPSSTPDPFIDLTIPYLRERKYQSALASLEKITQNSNYTSYLTSYTSDNLRVNGLLTIPLGQQPVTGWPAIVFVHGYIPPKQYATLEKYQDYVDFLARNGFVVFKIDLRGHGSSEGEASGAYYSSDYVIDTLNAQAALQSADFVNPNSVGLWGHSMAGNLVLRAMLVSSEIKAGVIWAGAVYSYRDFVAYRINDTSYAHRPFETKEGEEQRNRETSPNIQKIREDPDSVDFADPFWTSISLTANLKYLENPIQIHHALDDAVVDVGYSRDLVEVLKTANKLYEFYEYDGGGHNITSPYFETAMERTVEFFRKTL